MEQHSSVVATSIEWQSACIIQGWIRRRQASAIRDRPQHFSTYQEVINNAEGSVLFRDLLLGFTDKPIRTFSFHPSKKSRRYERRRRGRPPRQYLKNMLLLCGDFDPVSLSMKDLLLLCGEYDPGSVLTTILVLHGDIYELIEHWYTLVCSSVVRIFSSLSSFSSFSGSYSSLLHTVGSTRFDRPVFVHLTSLLCILSSVGEYQYVE